MVQLLQSGRHSWTGRTGAYAAAAKALHNHILHDMRENARSRRFHSPRPTRAGAICSYPQPLTLLCCPATKTAAPMGSVKKSKPRPSRDPKYRGWEVKTGCVRKTESRDDIRVRLLLAKRGFSARTWCSCLRGSSQRSSESHRQEEGYRISAELAPANHAARGGPRDVTRGDDMRNTRQEGTRVRTGGAAVACHPRVSITASYKYFSSQAGRRGR